MDWVLFRALERILAVIVGGIAIYLGYRLFLHIPNERDGEGRVKLPGDISIYLTRVGPGVFFALFGTIVVGASFFYGVNIETPAGTYTGIGHQPEAAPEETSSTSQRTIVQRQIALLNEAKPALYDIYGSARRSEVDYYLSGIKMQLMQTVWGEDWGDPAVFKAWVQTGAVPADTTRLRRARRFYEHGEVDGL